MTECSPCFKGTCSHGIYDNMKTAVETIFGRQRSPLQSPFHADAQPPAGRLGGLYASGWEKSQVGLVPEYLACMFNNSGNQIVCL